MTLDLTIAEHLCTRLCHDLAGPVGAINNGAEFLAEDKSMLNDALALIASSAKEAVARLQFYRHAYGKLNEHGEADMQEKKKLAEALFANSKITLDWPNQHAATAGVSVSQKMGQLLLNQIILASRALVRGGKLSVRIEEGENGARVMTAVAHADALKPDEEAEAILAGDGEEIPISPKTVQAYFTRELAREMGIALTFERGEHSYGLCAKRL